MDDSFWREVLSLEERIRSDILDLGERVAPLNELNRQLAGVRGKLEMLEELLRKGTVLAATRETLVETNKANQRLESHQEEVKKLQHELQSLRMKLRRNSELQAAKERERLLARKDQGETVAKKSAVRSAERGTNSLREANAMMMQEVRLYLFVCCC